MEEKLLGGDGSVVAGPEFSVVRVEFSICGRRGVKEWGVKSEPWQPATETPDFKDTVTQMMTRGSGE